MQFACLASGSRGNALLVEDGNTCLLLDCGLSAREIETRLTMIGRIAADLAAIVVTHEHGDHVRGVGALARRYQLPVWMTAGTYRAAADRLRNLPRLELYFGGRSFEIDDLELNPISVPHDALEPCQFVFSNGDYRLGVFTDTGSWTPAICDQLTGVDALVLECNHDHEMLWQGDYPQALKRRIASDHGHLDNLSAAELLASIGSSRLQHLVAAHLSEKNNTPDIVRKTLSAHCQIDPNWLQIASQDKPTPWCYIENHCAQEM